MDEETSGKILGVLAGLLIGAVIGFLGVAIFIVYPSLPHYPADPGIIMSDGLKNLDAKGYGSTPPQIIYFSAGTMLSASESVKGTAISPNWVKFVSTSGISGSDCSAGKSLSISSSADNLKVCKSATLFTTVCGDSSRNKYCIAIASTENGSSNLCGSACGLG